MRKFTIGDEKPFKPRPQPMPVLEWVRISDLVIDDSYQRPLGKSNWRKIRLIAAEFSWSRFTPALCARTSSGLIAVVDGQHRVHAALLCGYSHVPVMITDMDDREQAQAFTRVNDQVTRISPFHIYKAALAAHEEWAVSCRDAVEAAGCTLMTYNASTANKKSGEVYSLILVRDLIARGQGHAVTRGLSALREYDRTGRVALFAACILRPWLGALAGFSDIDATDLVAFLQGHDPYRIIDRLDRIRKESGATGKTPASLERSAFLNLLIGFHSKEKSVSPANIVMMR